ncbi:MAG TPA: hypothetical protein VHV53_00540 [Solirubrobacterales bacterium]|jgi:hypothetical protein|nr:hypothetical protein [Solirubrobacterales bacterium]
MPARVVIAGGGVAAIETAGRQAGGHLAPEWRRGRTVWRARMEWDDHG